MPKIEQFDVIIIGGGLAGVSCSLELQDNNVKHILLEKDNCLGGQIPLIVNQIRNMAGVLFENGSALQNTLNKTASELNLPLLLGEEVIAVDLTEKIIKTAASTLGAKAIVLATGARQRTLHLSAGNYLSDQVFYMTEGKEEQIKGKNIVVIGGGDSALIEALSFARNSKQVILVHKNEKFRARPDLMADLNKHKNIDVRFNSQVIALYGQSKIESVTVKNIKTNHEQLVSCEVVIAKIGRAPNSELFVGQIETDLNSHIKINNYMETSKAGVYAIGDITSPAYWRLSVAAGQGSTAARSIMKYLWE